MTLISAVGPALALAVNSFSPCLEQSHVRILCDTLQVEKEYIV